MVALAKDDRLRGLAHSEPGHQGPTYSVASGLGVHLLGHPHTDVGGPGVLADPGPFPWLPIREGKELRSSAF